MKKQFQQLANAATCTAAIILSATGCKKDYNTNYPPATIYTVVKAVSGDSLGIVVKMNEYRLLAGNQLNSTTGVTGGRREVNWDAVPATFTNANNFPSDFFGSSDAALPDGRKRGLLLQNTGTSFRVDSTDFTEVEPSYATTFETFSKKKLFVYMGNNVTEVSFKVPGTNTDAYVKGFGAVFTDVDDANSTSLEFFSGSKSLGTYKVPVRTATGSFSFLGVNFPDEKIIKVRITEGNGLLGSGVKDISNGGTKDLVVMDDFIYDEPRPFN
ncbi:MAG: hypothetical protein ABI760_19315 [Ferruginibacter sp.]